jgi:hypothetical protein
VSGPAPTACRPPTSRSTHWAQWITAVVFFHIVRFFYI